MESPKATADLALRLERRIAASPEKVFAAWTTAEGLSRWFSPTAEYAVHVHALDVRVGGRYRIEMRHSGGASNIVIGTYLEISPPRRMVYTWQWEAQGPETLVTVMVEPDGTGSHLVLLHEKFADTDARDKHNQGWTGCLERLLAAVR